MQKRPCPCSSFGGLASSSDFARIQTAGGGHGFEEGHACEGVTPFFAMLRGFVARTFAVVSELSRWHNAIRINKICDMCIKAVCVWQTWQTVSQSQFWGSSKVGGDVHVVPVGA